MSRLPTDPNSLFQHAVQLHQAGQLQAAIQIYRDLWARFPKNTNVLFFLGTAECQLGDFQNGADHLGRFIKDNPRNAEAYNNRGNALKELGRFEEAEICFNRAIQLKPNDAETFFNRAELYRHWGRRREALVDLNRSIEIDPSGAGHVNRAQIYEELGRFDEAHADIQYVLTKQPQEPRLYYNLGRLLVLKGEHVPALAAYDQALSLQPSFVEALNNRGNLLMNLGRGEEGLADLDAAIRLAPEFGEAVFNKAVALDKLRRLDESVAVFSNFIESDASSIRKNEALWNKSNTLLLQGDYTEGWKAFEARWLEGRHRIGVEHFSIPLWLGDADLSGKTLLVHAERGLGDTLQFCRYVPLLAKRGIKVIFAVQAPLLELMRGIEGPTEVCVLGKETGQAQYHVPLMSLPLVFGTSLDSIPAEIPYLQAKHERIAAWRAKLGPKESCRVGLVWSGGFRPDLPDLWEVNNRRNIPLKRLAPLGNLPCEFFSLQKGDDAVMQLRDLEQSAWGGPRILDYTDDLHDFAETAALITQLDLVISVDTSTAHLAAAMGKPVWLMNRYDTCWRWLLDRSDTPWYPSMRLFRQPVPGEWDTVIREMMAAFPSFLG